MYICIYLKCKIVHKYIALHMLVASVYVGSAGNGIVYKRNKIILILAS